MSATHPPQHVVNKLLSEVVSRTQPLNTDPSTLTPEAQARGELEKPLCNFSENDMNANSFKEEGKCTCHEHGTKLIEKKC